MINKYLTKPELKSDALQHIALIVLSYDRVKILSMWQRNELKWFIGKIIKNQLHSDRSDFYKTFVKYNNNSEEFEDYKFNGIENADYINDALEEDKLLKNINQHLKDKEMKSTRDNFDSTIFQDYINSGKTMREIAKEIGIHHVSVHLAIKRTREELRDKYKNK
jgi:DNA-directed RNA polymerase specialized sigma24 family protein